MAAPPRRIVVGFDGTDGARRALESAARLAGYGSTLTVVAVARDEGDGAGDILASARDLLVELRISATYVQRFGDPAEELVGAAGDLGADLVVVGRRGRVEASRHEPGSVSADVVRLAPCDVLVVG